MQLGEILKAYGHFQEAALHLRHVLELRPNHEPALAILKEMEAAPDSTVHVYTLLIIGTEFKKSCILFKQGCIFDIEDQYELNSYAGLGCFFRLSQYQLLVQSL